MTRKDKTMPIRELSIGTEITATRDDLIADYIPDSSGRYRLFRVGDYLVTSINDAEVFAERLTRAPEYDGPIVNAECYGHADDDSTVNQAAGAEHFCDGSCNRIDRAEWMLTERFGNCGDLGDDGVVWIDGEAYTVEWADRAISVSAPPADTCLHVYDEPECPYCDLPRPAGWGKKPTTEEGTNMTEPRVIARASVQIPVQPEFGGGTIDETATVVDYPDQQVVVVEVEHYDGTRAVEFDYPKWRAFRAAIMANGTVREGAEQ